MGRAAMGERLGGFIYGTILVLSVVIAGNKAYPSDPGHIAAFVAVTIIVFWLAHVYSHGLAHSVGHDEHLSFAELRRIAHRESSLLEAAAPLRSAGAFCLTAPNPACVVAPGSSSCFPLSISAAAPPLLPAASRTYVSNWARWACARSTFRCVIPSFCVMRYTKTPRNGRR